MEGPKIILGGEKYYIVLYQVTYSRLLCKEYKAMIRLLFSFGKANDKLVPQKDGPEY
jgi:hypothetical protein